MTKQKEIPIRDTEYGLANHYGDFIEVHKDLKGYDYNLYWKVVRHELKHSERPLTIHDIKLDLTDKSLKGEKRKLFKFMRTRPKTWLQFLPLWKHPEHDEWVVDYSLLMAYGILIPIVYGLIWLMIKIFTVATGGL